jgi:hypothetical protein
MRDKCRVLLIVVILALAATAGWAASDQASGKAVCVFPLVNIASNAAQQDHQGPLSEAVRQEFEAVGFSVVPQGQWAPEAAKLSLKPEGIADPPQALEIARNSGADMAVAGFYQMDNNRILVSVQCYDVSAGTLITGFSHTWRFNLGFYNALHAQIADLIQKVVFSSAPRLITLKESVRVDQITFTSAQNGMEVFVEGQESAGRIQDGSLVFPAKGVRAGTLLRVEKKQEGYHTVWQSVRAAPEIALTPLPKKNILSLEVDWTAGELEGAGAALRWYPVPDWFYLGLSEYLFTQVPMSAAGTWPIHNDSELLLGLYLFWPPQAPFRMGISAGGGVFVTWVPSSASLLYTDVYINVLNIFFELRAGNVKLFARVDGKITLGIGNDLLGGNVVTWNSLLPPFTFGVVIPWL